LSKYLKMMKPLFTKWYAKYILLLACILILLVVPLLRPTDAGLIGSESYLNLRLAENPSLQDDLSFGGRFAAYEWGTPLVLSIAPNIMISLLPLLLGVATFILLWSIIKKLYNNQRTEKLAMILFLLSPSFLYIFSFGNSLFIPTFLCVLTFFVFIQKKWSWLSIPLVVLLPFFNIVLLASLIICMFFYVYFQNKKKRKLFFTLLLVGLVVSLAYYGFMLYNTGIPHNFTIEESNWMNFFQYMLYDFGSGFGIGIFLLVLVIVGMSSKWDKKYTNLFMFFSVFALIVFSFFRIEVLIILNMFFCVIGAWGIESFLDKRKSSTFITYTLIIVLCGLVFSGISQLDNLVESEPNAAMVDALDYLETREDGVVLSDYRNGIYINYAGHKNVIDENYLFVDDAEERFNDVTSVYYYRDLDSVEEIFEKYDIKYVLIDEQMKEEIWEYDSQGLLFILQYTRDFIKLYDKDGVEVWIKEEL
jgi:hypothetical protein